jgi:hypothetical protein
MNEAKQIESIIALAQKIKQLKQETSDEIKKIKETLAILSEKLSEIKVDEKLLEINEKLNEKIKESQNNFEKRLGELQKDIVVLSNLRNDLEILQNKILTLEDEIKIDNERLQATLERTEELNEIITQIEKEFQRIKAVINRINQKVLTAVWGFTLLINGVEKGSYSRFNLIAGDNITFDISENRQEGRINLKINSTGGVTSNEFVPYTGATRDVDLGDYYLYTPMLFLKNLGSVAFMDMYGGEVGELSMQPSPPVIMFYNAINDVQVNFDMSQLTTDRTLIIPDTSGTIATKEDAIIYAIVFG